MNGKLKNIIHECDFCVVGGGLAGMCAAISAARHGLFVVIIHDRPMFGGNASSEIRMWVSGAHGDNNRETGILEEINLENLYRNPYRNYPIWDSILYEVVKNEKNITVLLNCSCLDAECENGIIKNVVGWQLTTQLYHTVKAKLFADCSGDSILAPLTGAEYTSGREGRDVYGEVFGPDKSDKYTMGNSCLIQARETDEKHPFIAPEWAYKFTKEKVGKRFKSLSHPHENFWYLELGGTQDTIADAEEIRDELVALAYGFWDYIKNSGECDADNWELDFVGFLPGKRENRRYIGDYVMTQHDVSDGGKFEDLVAFGGWTMDDHNPEGLYSTAASNKHYPAPSPFGIPYRSLYSKNIENLFFAGRNISVSHAAMSATRVMATCATMGQAVGTAAAIASQNNLSPRGVYEEKLSLLQQTLIDDDCYLPTIKMQHSDIVKNAKITSNGVGEENLTNGYDRKIGEYENCWQGKQNDTICITLEKEEFVRELRITLDSDINRTTVGGNPLIKHKSTVTNYPKNQAPVTLPTTLVRDMKIEVLTKDGESKSFIIKDNRRRVIRQAINENCIGIKITPIATYGDDTVRIFSLNLK